MNRKQISAISVIVLATTLVGIILTATMPIWLTAILVMPSKRRNDLTDKMQYRIAREMTKFMFRSHMTGKQLA